MTGDVATLALGVCGYRQDGQDGQATNRPKLKSVGQICGKRGYPILARHDGAGKVSVVSVVRRGL